MKKGMMGRELKKSVKNKVVAKSMLQNEETNEFFRKESQA